MDRSEIRALTIRRVQAAAAFENKKALPKEGSLVVSSQCGATPLETRAREELEATGARPRRIMRTGIDALTPSELRIARMAAEGLENKQIAQALFVTVKTVETHLGHVYAKLDISSHKDLPRALGEAG